jgi:hypothetical protein
MNQDAANMDDCSEEDWTDRAICKGMIEVFFGPSTERPGRRAERLAIAASCCALCPVATTCREEGRRGNEHGLWGGESEVERAAAGYAPRSPSRRSVIAARDAHRRQEAEVAAAGLAEITDLGPQRHLVH